MPQPLTSWEQHRSFPCILNCGGQLCAHGLKSVPTAIRNTTPTAWLRCAGPWRLSSTGSRLRRTRSAPVVARPESPGRSHGPPCECRLRRSASAFGTQSTGNGTRTQSMGTSDSMCSASWKCSKYQTAAGPQNQHGPARDLERLWRVSNHPRIDIKGIVLIGFVSRFVLPLAPQERAEPDAPGRGWVGLDQTLLKPARPVSRAT